MLSSKDWVNIATDAVLATSCFTVLVGLPWLVVAGFYRRKAFRKQAIMDRLTWTQPIVECSCPTCRTERKGVLYAAD